jgi:ATP-binding cassette, subfamily B, bacterial
MSAWLQTLGANKCGYQAFAHVLSSTRETVSTAARTAALAAGACPTLASLMVLLHLGQALVPGVQAWIYKVLVETVVAPDTLDSRSHSVWLAVVIYLSVLFLSQAATLYLPSFADQIAEKLEGRTGAALLALGERQKGLAFYSDPNIHNDLNMVRGKLSYALLEVLTIMPEIVEKTLAILILAVLIGRMHPIIPILLIVSAVPRFIQEGQLRRYIWAGMSARSPHFRWLNYLARILLGTEFAKEVRLFGFGDYILSLYRTTFARAHRELEAIRRQQQVRVTASAVLNALVTGGVYAWIVFTAARGNLSVGDVTLYAAGTFQLSGLLSRLTSMHGTLVEHYLTMRTFFRLVDLEPGIATPSPGTSMKSGTQVTGTTNFDVSPISHVRSHETPHSAPELEFQAVGFCYPNSAVPALRDFNLRIAPGEKIAIVGENGAGKTTLLSLIARLYDPTEGQILVDGIPLVQVDVDHWRARLAVVSQDFLRMDASVRENVGIGNVQHWPDDSTLLAACEQAGVAQAVRALPKELDQMLGRRFEGGVELSTGEWQKLAIARVLVRPEADIVILDEPTSALDASTEAAVFQQFLKISASRTAILVSHRFSTVRAADRIIVLDQGQIVEQGTHDELMRKGGMYSTLFNMQAARYRE